MKKQSARTQYAFEVVSSMMRAMTLEDVAKHYLAILRTRRPRLLYAFNAEHFMVLRSDAKRLCEEALRHAFAERAKVNKNVAWSWPKIASVGKTCRVTRDATPAEAARYFANAHVVFGVRKP